MSRCADHPATLRSIQLFILLLHFCLRCHSTEASLKRSQQYWMPAFADDAGSGAGGEGGARASGYFRLAYWRSLELLPEAEQSAASWLSNRCRSEAAEPNVDDDSDVQLLTDNHLQKAGSLLFWPMISLASGDAALASPIVTVIPFIMSFDASNTTNVSYQAPSDSHHISNQRLAFLHASPGRLGLRFGSIGRVSLTACTVRGAAASQSDSPLVASSPTLSRGLLLAPALAALMLALAAGFVCWSWRRAVKPGLAALAAAAAAAAAASAGTAASSCSPAADSWRNSRIACTPCECQQLSQQQVSFVVPAQQSFQQRCMPRARSTPYPGQQKQQQQQQQYPLHILSHSQDSPLLLQMQSAAASCRTLAVNKNN